MIQHHELIELLERWHSGDFTAADERRLHTLLAQCDEFEREAIQGLLSVPETDHAPVLQRLYERIDKVSDQRKSRPAWRVWLAPLAVAASLALVVFFAPQLFNTADQSGPVAQQLPEPESAPVATSPETPTESASANSVQPSSPIASKSAPATPGKSQQLNDKVSGNIVADAAPSVLSKPVQSATDDVEAESAPAELREVVVPAARDMSKVTEEKADAAKKSAAMKPAPGGAASNGFALTAGGPVPENGWPAFQQFWMRNLQQSTFLNSVNNVQSVSIRFNVDSSTGKPVNIQVQNNINTLLSKEIRQLMENTRWVVPEGASSSGQLQVPLKM